MAKLNQRPRATKANPFPREQAPLARWKRDDRQESGSTDFLALRSDGSLVQRTKFESWTSAWHVIAKGPLTIEQVDQRFGPRGFARETP